MDRIANPLLWLMVCCYTALHSYVLKSVSERISIYSGVFTTNLTHPTGPWKQSTCCRQSWTFLLLEATVIPTIPLKFLMAGPAGRRRWKKIVSVSPPCLYLKYLPCSSQGLILDHVWSKPFLAVVKVRSFPVCSILSFRLDGNYCISWYQKKETTVCWYVQQ